MAILTAGIALVGVMVPTRIQMEVRVTALLVEHVKVLVVQRGETKMSRLYTRNALYCHHQVKTTPNLFDQPGQ